MIYFNPIGTGFLENKIIQQNRKKEKSLITPHLDGKGLLWKWMESMMMEMMCMLGMNNCDGEWPVSYHGMGMRQL